MQYINLNDAILTNSGLDFVLFLNQSVNFKYTGGVLKSVTLPQYNFCYLINSDQFADQVQNVSLQTAAVGQMNKQHATALGREQKQESAEGKRKRELLTLFFLLKLPLLYHEATNQVTCE